MKNPYADSDRLTLCQRARDRAVVLFKRAGEAILSPNEGDRGQPLEDERALLLDTGHLLESLVVQFQGDGARLGNPRQSFLIGRMTLAEAYDAELVRMARAGRLECLMDATDFILGSEGRAWISARDQARRSRYDLALDSNEGLAAVLEELEGMAKRPSK